MATRRRDSRGRFIKSRRSNSSRRRRPTRRRGMGSIYAVKTKRGMGGLGALSSDAFMSNVLPLLVGVGVTGGTVFAIKRFVSPNDTTRTKLREYAPLAGAGVGAIAGMSLKWLANDDAALTAVLSSAMVGGLLMIPGFAMAAATPAPVPPEVVSDGGAGTAGLLGRGRGTGAIVPEYNRGGMGAIVMQPSANGQRPGSIGSYGESVALSGINTDVFGTPGF